MIFFAVPAALLGLLAIPIWIAVYRRRRRTTEVPVAGTFLWQRAIRDVGRRPRFAADALLALRLLLWSLLVLAAAGPTWRAPTDVLKVVVLDTSSSMSAADGASTPVAQREGGTLPGATRFDVAKAVIVRWIRDGDRIAVVRGGADVEVVVAPGTAVGDALLALDRLVPVDGTARLAEAVHVARNLAANVGPAELHWFSDEPPPGLADWTVHPLAGEGTNVGITGFEVVAGQAWIRVTSNHPGPVSVPIRTFRGDTEVGSTVVLVPAGGDASVTLPWLGSTEASSVRLDPPPGDSMTVDDVAFAAPQRVVVALDRSEGIVERALRSVPDVEVRIVAPSTIASVPADLKIVGRDTAARHALRGPTVVLPSSESDAVAALVTDWVRSDPTLRFVDLSELVVAYVPFGAPPVGEAPAWRTLVRGEVAAPDGSNEPPSPVPLVRMRDAGVDGDGGFVLDLAFHPSRGDLAVRVAFPTWMLNVVDAARGRQRLILGERLPASSADGTSAAERVVRPGSYVVDGKVVATAPVEASEARLPSRAAFVDWDPAFVALPVPAVGPADRSAAGGAPVPRRPAHGVVAVLLVAALVVLWGEAWGSEGRRATAFAAPAVRSSTAAVRGLARRVRGMTDER